MITQLIDKVFGKRAATETVAYVLQRVESIPGDRIPPGKTLCVGFGSQLVNCYTDEIPAKKRHEAWWLVAAGDLSCQIELEQDGKLLQVIVDVGNAVLDQTISVEQAEHRLQQIASETAQRAGIPDPDLRRFRGLDLRLQNHDGDGLTSASLQSSAEDSPAFRTRRRPRTGWMLSSQSVDNRLRTHLRETTRQLSSAIDGFRDSRRDAGELVQIRRIHERLLLIHDMLETNPTLTPRAGLSVSRERRELVPLVPETVLQLGSVEVNCQTGRQQHL
jgi:hypothetical protein